jgi:polyferredoxin
VGNIKSKQRRLELNLIKYFLLIYFIVIQSMLIISFHFHKYFILPNEKIIKLLTQLIDFISFLIVYLEILFIFDNILL